MKLPQFEHFERRSLNKACSLLARYGVEASVLAGGTDLLVKMKQRGFVPGYAINLKIIPGMAHRLTSIGGKE